jgi:hypothetical protein
MLLLGLGIELGGILDEKDLLLGALWWRAVHDRRTG